MSSEADIQARLMQRLPRSWAAASDAGSPVNSLQAGFAAALHTATTDVQQALAQMQAQTAEGEWLDEWGAYLGVPRQAAEPDRDYAARTIAEVLRPRCNNAAMAAAIEQAFGQPCTVTDVQYAGGFFVLHNGAAYHNGSFTHSDAPTTVYGFFDVDVGYSLESGLDVADFAAAVRQFVEQFRAAGTQLRTVALGSTAMLSEVPTQDDDFLGQVNTAVTHNGARRFDGSLQHLGYTASALS